MDLPTVKKNNNLLEIARLLGKNMTEQENHLWYDFLQHYPIKIYKQRIIDDFVADFYCHQARLVIELDGSQHYTPEVGDRSKSGSRSRRTALYVFAHAAP